MLGIVKCCDERELDVGVYDGRGGAAQPVNEGFRTK
jgi:hypothetical protein